MILKYLKQNSGQSLVEALIALTAIVLIMTATTVGVITSLNNASFIKSQNQVNKIAQEGIEYIRDQIVNNSTAVGGQSTFQQYSSYNGIRCMDGSYALSADTGANNPCTSLVDNKFSRKVTFATGVCDNNTPPSPFADGLKVTVQVSWRDDKCPSSNPYCHNQEVTSCFVNPANLTAPTVVQGI